jgi:hypothetical protein
MNCVNYILDENYSNFMTEGVEVDEVSVEFGGIEILRGNEYPIEDISQSAEDEKIEEMVLELEEMTITKTKAIKNMGLSKSHALYTYYRKQGPPFQEQYTSKCLP